MDAIDRIILQHDCRGISAVIDRLEPGWCRRAAELILANPGTVLITTGFPVAGTFETDGPIGAEALAIVLTKLGSEPVFVCAPPVSTVLAQKRDTAVFPIHTRDASRSIAADMLEQYEPSLLIAVERPGAAADGRYYNMNGIDITDTAAKVDLLFETASCPTIGIGDGGNEIGMGLVHDALSKADITPSLIPCTELIPASVSNWGAYGIIAALSISKQKDFLADIDPAAIMEHMIAGGAVDGISGKAIPTEDGFELKAALGIIQELEDIIHSEIQE